MYVICYYDRNDPTKTGFTNANTRPEALNWIESNPDKLVVYLFDEKRDEHQANIVAESHFLKNCEKHGLKPLDLHATFMANDHKYQIVGYYPSNKKYKFKLYDYDSDTYVKATAAWVAYYLSASRQEFVHPSL